MGDDVAGNRSVGLDHVRLDALVSWSKVPRSTTVSTVSGQEPMECIRESCGVGRNRGESWGEIYTVIDLSLQ